MSVATAIYGILSTTTAVTSVVSTRIYPDAVPQNAAFPYVTFQEVTVQPTDTKDGASKLDICRIQVDCYSQAYDTTQNLGAAVRAALDRFSGTSGGETIDKIIFTNRSSGATDFELHVFWLSLDFDIRLLR